MFTTTETVGFASHNNLKYLLHKILQQDEVLYIVTEFAKGSRTDGTPTYLAFTSNRIFEFYLENFLLNKFTQYYKDETPRELLEILHNLDSASYFNDRIQGFDLNITDGQDITISFVESGKIHKYIKQTHITQQLQPYLDNYMKHEHLDLAKK